VFLDPEITEEEEKLLQIRNDILYEILNQFGKNNNLGFLNINEFHNKEVIMASKQELKRYEKELEVKSGNLTNMSSMNFIDEKELNKNNSFNLSNYFDSNQNKDMINIFNVDKNKEFLPNKKPLFVDESSTLNNNDKFILENNENSINFNQNLQKKKKVINDIVINDEIVRQSKKSAFENLHSIAKTHENMINDQLRRTSSLYKSKILNDLYMKLTLFNNLTDFEIQILILLTQIAVKDIVNAKISETNYEGELNPEDLLDLLKKFKHEINSDNNLN